MSTEAAPAASPESAPSTEQSAASTPATDTPSRAARRARAVAAIEARDTPAAPAADEAADLSETPSAEAPPQAESREDRIAKRLEAQRKAREEKHAAHHKAQLDQAILSRAQNDQASIERRIREDLRSQYRRDPIAFHKEHGEGGVEDALQRLTKEMLAQGHGRVASEQEMSKSELKQLREQFEAYQAQQEEQRAIAAAEGRRNAFVTQTGDAMKWPILAKLDPQERLEEGIYEWRRYAEEQQAKYGPHEVEYDAELVADLIEARLERRKKAYAEQAAPQVQTQPQAAVKRAKTITPQLASDQGAQPTLSRAERKARIVSRLERADAARRAGNTTSQ